MADNRNPTPSNKNVSIGGDVVDSVVITGDHNTVNQTIIQKFFNIFKSDSETLEQRNRRILLGHVENAWIKGVLDASLHGVALLDLGIKPDPEAVTKYPWTIKKESTNETLPAGTSMLEIFDSIGMGRSLLILGAPGSGKTTMLLELVRQLIQLAREDVTYPIPMVFNLASWVYKETQDFADWLAQELNNQYSIPRKAAPDWMKENKLLFLLDGLDEVRQESRAKCVEAINVFRKEHGLTSLAVCSRSQDYADLNAKLSFEGAIEVQPLTQEQIAEFFNRFGDEMAGIKQALEKDSALREMAETPLFLSIMILAYRDKQDIEILFSQDEKAQRKHLFDTYIERMFERPRSENENFKRDSVIHWLSWLASNMILFQVTPYQLENLQPGWLRLEKRWSYSLIGWLIGGLIFGPIGGLIGGGLIVRIFGLSFAIIGGVIGWLILGLAAVIAFSSDVFLFSIHLLDWDLDFEDLGHLGLLGYINGIVFGLVGGLVGTFIGGLNVGVSVALSVLLSLTLSIVVGYLFLQASLGVIQYYTLRFILARNNYLPLNLVPFLDHCVDLVFLRRVGGGYIFVHRLLMEHFAEMYVETPTSKGN